MTEQAHLRYVLTLLQLESDRPVAGAGSALRALKRQGYVSHDGALSPRGESWLHMRSVADVHWPTTTMPGCGMRNCTVCEPVTQPSAYDGLSVAVVDGMVHYMGTDLGRFSVVVRSGMLHTDDGLIPWLSHPDVGPVLDKARNAVVEWGAAAA